MGSRLGRIRPGDEADLTIFKVESGAFRFRDPWGAERPGTQRVTPLYTVRAGEVRAVGPKGVTEVV